MPIVDDQSLDVVRLLRFPLPLWLRAQEHVDELLREFALVTQGEAAHPDSVPRRLLDLIAALSATYAGMAARTEEHRDDAIRRGETETDLTYQVPPGVSAAVRQLGEMLDEADEYCRQGAHLLTLQTPPEQVRFRRWFLSEFEVQLAGGPATPWPDDTAAAP